MKEVWPIRLNIAPTHYGIITATAAIITFEALNGLSPNTIKDLLTRAGALHLD